MFVQAGHFNRTMGEKNKIMHLGLTVGFYMHSSTSDASQSISLSLLSNKDQEIVKHTDSLATTESLKFLAMYGIAREIQNDETNFRIIP